MIRNLSKNTNIIGFVAKVVGSSLISQTLSYGLEAGALQRSIEQQLPPIDILQGVGPNPSPPQENVPSDPNAIKVLVLSFSFEGVTLFSEEELQSVVVPWVGKEVKLSDLQDAANAVSAFYQSKGRLAQVSIPPQTLENGKVLLKILEAKLGSVGVVKDPDLDIAEDRIASYVTEESALGTFIDTDQVERSIFLLKETPGIANVTTELEPGKNDGEVALNLKVDSANIFSGMATLNNYGSASTGIYQANALLTYANPFGIGDQFTFNAIGAQGLANGYIAYSLPIGVRGTKLSLSSNYMSYRNIGDFYENGSTGNASTLDATLMHALYRSATTNANISLDIAQKTYLNRSNANGITTSNYQINDITFGVNGNHYDGWAGGGVTTGSLSLTSGNLSSLGVPYAATTNLVAANTPSSFQKINFSISRNQQIIQNKTAFIATINGQFANANLDPAEQFYLGGPYGVQSYPSGQGKGAQGFMLQLELQQLFQDNLIGSLVFQAGRVQQFVNPYDGWQGNTNANNWYSLAGIGPSIKWSSGRFSLSGNVSWAIGQNPLYNNAGDPANVDNRSPPIGLAPAYFWLQTSYAF